MKKTKRGVSNMVCTCLHYPHEPGCPDPQEDVVMDDFEKQIRARLEAAGTEATPWLITVARIGAEIEREECVREATEDWAPDAHWPYSRDDPRSKCGPRKK